MSFMSWYPGEHLRDEVIDTVLKSGTAFCKTVEQTNKMNKKVKRIDFLNIKMYNILYECNA